MSPQEIEKLLGGYATDTLTVQERRTLFEAALGNQELFDALADEQALRELLQDPVSRAHLLGVLREPKPSAMARMLAWLRRPSAIALASAVAAGMVVIAVVSPSRKVARYSEVAMSKPAEPKSERAPIASAPEPKPAAQPVQPRVRTNAPKKQEEFERDAAKPARQAEASQVAQSKVADNVQPSAPAAPPPQAVIVTANPPAAVSAPAPAEARKEASKDEPTQNARDLYYAGQPGAAAGFRDEQNSERAAKRTQAPRTFGGAVGRMSAPRAATRLPGVHYTILKRNADGSFADADPAGPFAVGDALRIRFEANQPGALEVFERQANGNWSLRMGARMREGESVSMPAESTINVRTPGDMRFRVRFLRTLGQQTARMDQVTPAQNQVRERVANSMYVVNKSPAADAAVEFEVAIVAK